MDNVVKIVKVRDIIPDENQPRKYFDSAKMKYLKNSIEKHGIITPLVVEDMGNGKFLLMDGERRFRSAVDLKLSEVPVIVESPKSAIERLIRQFNVQEQHEGWSPVEKAVAISTLAKEMGLSLPKTCELLGVSPGEQVRYVAFTQLADKTLFVRSEIPLDYAIQFRQIISFVERIIVRTFEEKWNINDARRLEKNLILLVKNGEITGRGDFIRMRDALTKKPELAKKLLDHAISPNDLFSEAKARGAYHLRNALANANYLATHANRYLAIQDVKMTPDMITKLKSAKDSIERILATQN